MKNIIHTILLLYMLCCAVKASAYDVNRIQRPWPIGHTDPLPMGWKFKDVGNISPSTDWCYDSSQRLIYMRSYGQGVNAQQKGGDEFGFIYFETDDDKQVSVRIMDAEVYTPYASPFIMLRGGLNDNDAMAKLELYEAGGNTISFGLRSKAASFGSATTARTGTVGSTKRPPNCFPRWIKMVREGLYIQAFHKDDVEGALWVKLSSVKKLELRGKAYMGIGACGNTMGSASAQPSIFLFDNLEVEEIESPYEVLNPEEVSTAFKETLRPGKSKDIDVTNVFGHALGDYFTIDVTTTNPNIATAYFWEKKVYNPTDGEEFRKYIRVTGLNNGITAVQMECTINGFTMNTDYPLNIFSGKPQPKTAITNPPFGWEMKNLEIPVNPDLFWGDPFIYKRLSLQKRYPCFIGSWEYDWSESNNGTPDGGNHGATVGNNPPITTGISYISGAKSYIFRDQEVEYTTENGFPYNMKRKEIKGASSIDLAFIAATDTANQIKNTEYFSIDRGSDGTYFWDTSVGFWSEIINYWTLEGYKVRGFPYLTNINPGDWVAYTVHAPRSGYYALYPIAATRETNKSMRIDVNGVTQIKEMKLTKGNKSNDWRKGEVCNIYLNEGKNQLRFYFNSADVNFMGMKCAFVETALAPYAGYKFDTTRYVKAEMRVDQSLLTDEELELYSRYEAGTLGDTLSVTAIDSFLLTLPTNYDYDPKKVVQAYKYQLGNFQGNSRNDSVAYIKQHLTHTFDSLTFYTTQQSQFKHIDVTTYLYKRGIDATKPIELTLKVDSIGNTGSGSLMGIMLRSLYREDDQLTLPSNNAYVSFAASAYQGARLSYRWGYNYDLKKLDNKSIAQSVYLKVRLNEFAPGYLTAYYSYDNLYWWDYLADPLKVEFLQSQDINEIAAGFFITGGNFASSLAVGMATTSNLSLTVYDQLEEMEPVNKAIDRYCAPLTMSSTAVTHGENITISFNNVRPGLVSLGVYDSYGRLVETLQDFTFMPYSKELITLSHTFSQLQESGVYLLRLEAPENQQYIRFRYTK